MDFSSRVCTTEVSVKMCGRLLNGAVGDISKTTEDATNNMARMNDAFARQFAVPDTFEGKQEQEARASLLAIIKFTMNAQLIEMHRHMKLASDMFFEHMVRMDRGGTKPTQHENEVLVMLDQLRTHKNKLYVEQFGSRVQKMRIDHIVLINAEVVSDTM